jgi:BirA family biotin operon repressor/biotin-[acetyl-CoA-carboxylase] ligase
MPSDDSAPLNAALLSAASPWGLPVEILAETTSSNDELLRVGEAGAPSGTLLFAERQTAGRGQFQRPWISTEPLGLWFSLLLRLEISDITIPALSAFAAVALVEALGELGIPGLQEARIKAPNDVFLAGRKTAGILVETRTGKYPFAVVGIGLNVNQQPEDFPPELRNLATSLAIASGHARDRNRVAASLLSALGRCERLMRADSPELLATWESLLIEPVALPAAIPSP